MASTAEPQVSGWRAVVMADAADFGDRLGGIWEISLPTGSCVRRPDSRPGMPLDPGPRSQHAPAGNRPLRNAAGRGARIGDRRRPRWPS